MDTITEVIPADRTLAFTEARTHTQAIEIACAELLKRVQFSRGNEATLRRQIMHALRRAHTELERLSKP